MSTLRTEVTIETVESLIQTRTREGRLHEYKRTIPGNGDREVKEFLADVSSFANTAGGLLLLGIREEGGVPIEVVGVAPENIDAEVARLDSMIRDGIEPRIPGVQIVPISIANQVVLAIDVRRSWALPHAVTARKHWRFYARNSNGKYPLDVGELRGHFEFSASARDRINLIRSKRLGAITAGETPVPVATTATTVLHIISFNSLDPGFAVDLNNVSSRSIQLRPILASSWDFSYSMDGFATYCRSSSEPAARSYTLIMRDGVLEAVDTILLEPVNGHLGVPSGAFERQILRVLPDYMAVLEAVGVTSPLVLLLSLLRVRGYSMSVNSFRFNLDGRWPLTRDELLLPGVVIEDLGAPAETATRPVFDLLWNAFGFERSYNYDEEGRWSGALS